MSAGYRVLDPSRPLHRNPTLAPVTAEPGNLENFPTIIDDTVSAVAPTDSLAQIPPVSSSVVSSSPVAGDSSSLVDPIASRHFKLRRGFALRDITTPPPVTANYDNVDGKLADNN